MRRAGTPIHLIAWALRPHLPISRFDTLLRAAWRTVRSPACPSSGKPGPGRVSSVRRALRKRCCSAAEVRLFPPCGERHGELRTLRPGLLSILIKSCFSRNIAGRLRTHSILMVRERGQMLVIPAARGPLDGLGPGHPEVVCISGLRFQALHLVFLSMITTQTVGTVSCAAVSGTSVQGLARDPIVQGRIQSSEGSALDLWVP